MRRGSFVCFVWLAAALFLGSTACSTAFWGGAATGAAGAGAAYEYQTKRQLEKLEEDYAEGEISREEYLKRKEEIESGSVVY